jgi:hypothetical protein
MSDEARVIGAIYGVTEKLDASLKSELAHPQQDSRAAEMSYKRFPFRVKYFSLSAIRFVGTR